MRCLVILSVLLASVAFTAAPVFGQTQSLEGQIVCCQDCWVKADRTKVPYGSKADLASAAQCIANGDPTLLAVMDGAGTTTFYQLENGKFKRPGKNWLSFVGQRVRVEGQTRKKQNANFVKIDSLTVLAEAPAATEEAPVAQGQPELQLNDLGGIPQKLSSFRGRIVVLNFWATYCLPCREEMPALAAIQNRYAAYGVQVIGATADLVDAKKDVLKFIREVKVNFPVWLEASTQDMVRFGLGPALPGTAIIDHTGKIVWTSKKAVTEAELKTQLDALLAQAEKSVAAVRPRPADVSSVPS
jgi:cytochrome c biogenesis protein CcmG, thiol:disulfide interchange protein DsbE